MLSTLHDDRHTEKIKQFYSKRLANDGFTEIVKNFQLPTITRTPIVRWNGSPFFPEFVRQLVSVISWKRFLSVIGTTSQAER